MKRGLVLGGASCVFDDAKRALELFTPDAVLAVNDMIELWPGPLDFAASLHAEKMEKWLNNRTKKGFAPVPQGCVYGYKQARNSKTNFRMDQLLTDWAGSSGLFGVRVLWHLGFDKIVVAGIPMEEKANHVARHSTWIHARSYRKGWEKNKAAIKDRVRSMSGWTRANLGEPTLDWLEVKRAIITTTSETIDGKAESAA